jgi:hypothetical protein
MFRNVISFEVLFPISHLSICQLADTLQKKVICFPVMMLLTKLSQAGNNLILPGQGEFG